jgi:uncharacterized protein YbjQ (UPF0145 family)
MLGLSSYDEISLAPSRITSSEAPPGFEITEVLGVVEGFCEKTFPILKIGSVGFHKGGHLDELISEAKKDMARAAVDKSADAVIGLRYQIMGRDVGKSALAYGTAVKCRRCIITTN